MLFLTCLYIILVVFLNVDLTVSTNLINPARPVELRAEEIRKRTWGSKTVILVEQCMCAIQWGTKACLLLLYWRLTRNLTESYVVKAAAAYVAVTYAVMLILYFAVWCRPFHAYWATPSANPQCTTALHHLITNLVFNLSSDLVILSIPLPLFLRARLEWRKRLLLVFPFALGFFTIVCAILSKNTSFTRPYSSTWVFWYCREASTTMIVANMPYSWALVRRAFKLRSFFAASSSGRVDTFKQNGSGHVQEVQGHSLGNLSSKTLRQESTYSGKRKPGFSLSWHSKATSKQNSTSNTNETVVDGGPSSTSFHQQIHQTSSTTDAIDRLYRLDEAVR